MCKAIEEVWGDDQIKVLDAFSGGGSIPFESVRAGFNTIANELNPVASIIERATIEYPMLFGKDLAKDIERIGGAIENEVTAQVANFFPRNPGEMDLCYIWVRTVRCPKCELIVPLAPNWWLDSKDRLAYRPIVPKVGESDVCSLRSSERAMSSIASSGSVKRGIGTCPRCGNIIDGDAIKQEGKSGNIGHQLAIIGYKCREGAVGSSESLRERTLTALKSW